MHHSVTALYPNSAHNRLRQVARRVSLAASMTMLFRCHVTCTRVLWLSLSSWMLCHAADGQCPLQKPGVQKHCANSLLQKDQTVISKSRILAWGDEELVGQVAASIPSQASALQEEAEIRAGRRRRRKKAEANFVCGGC